MKCPIMYEPGRWALIELPESQLLKPTVELAFRGKDEQVEPGAPRSLTSMVTWETKRFKRLELRSEDRQFFIYLP